MTIKIQVTGDRNYPLGAPVTIDGTAFAAVVERATRGAKPGDSPLSVETLIRLMWKTGVGIAERQLSSGATIDPTGAFVSQRHQQHRQRAAETADAARQIVARNTKGRVVTRPKA